MMTITMSNPDFKVSRHSNAPLQRVMSSPRRGIMLQQTDMGVSIKSNILHTLNQPRHSVLTCILLCTHTSTHNHTLSSLTFVSVVETTCGSASADASAPAAGIAASGRRCLGRTRGGRFMRSEKNTPRSGVLGDGVVIETRIRIGRRRGR